MKKNKAWKIGEVVADNTGSWKYMGYGWIKVAN